MHTVGGDARAFEPAGELAGEEDVGQLGVAVLAEGPETTLAVEVVEVEPTHAMAHG